MFTPVISITRIRRKGSVRPTCPWYQSCWRFCCSSRQEVHAGPTLRVHSLLSNQPGYRYACLSPRHTSRYEISYRRRKDDTDTTTQWAGDGNWKCLKLWFRPVSGPTVHGGEPSPCPRGALSRDLPLAFTKLPHMSFILADLLMWPPFRFPARWISCFWPSQPTVYQYQNYFNNNKLDKQRIMTIYHKN